MYTHAYIIEILIFEIYNWKSIIFSNAWTYFTTDTVAIYTIIFQVITTLFDCKMLRGRFLLFKILWMYLYRDFNWKFSSYLNLFNKYNTIMVIRKILWWSY